MALREILVAFGVQFDTKALANANNQIDGTIGKLKDMGAALAGAFALGKIKDFVFGLADQADHLRDQSIALKLSVREMQAWQHAAELNGLKNEEFASSFTKFNRNVAEAAEGQGAAADAFKKLGVNVKDSSGQLGRPIELLDGVAAGLQNIQDPAKRTAIVMDLFGKSGAKWLPLLSEGPEGLAKLRAEFDELGGGITQEFADASDELNDNLARLNVSVLSLKVRVAGFLIPAFNSAIQWFTRTVGGIRRMTEGTRIQEAAFGVLGTIGAATALKILSKWGPVLRAFTRQAFLIGLGILLLEDLIGTFEGKDSAIRRVIDGWFGEGSTQKVVDFFKGISDGLSKMADDARYHSDDFHTTWEATLADVRNDFDDTFLGHIAGETLSALVDAFFASVNAISGGWEDTVSYLETLGESLIFSFQVVWNDIQSMAETAAAGILDAFKAVGDGISSAFEFFGIDFGGAPDTDPSFSDFVKGRRQQREGDLYARAQELDKRLRGPNSIAERAGSGGAQNAREAFADISAPITIHQNFPPGTPVQQARQAADGAAAGARKGINRGAAAAFDRRGK